MTLFGSICSCLVSNIVHKISVAKLMFSDSKHASTYIQKYNKALLCYNICRSLLASRLLYDFCPIPALYVKIPDLYADIFLFGFYYANNLRGQVPVGCLRSVSNDSVRVIRRRGGRAGERWRRKLLRKCACVIILTCNLLRRSEARS